MFRRRGNVCRRFRLACTKPLTQAPGMYRVPLSRGVVKVAGGACRFSGVGALRNGLVLISHRLPQERSRLDLRRGRGNLNPSKLTPAVDKKARPGR